MRPSPFEKLAGSISVAVGIGGLAYSISFVTFLKNGSETAAKLAAFFLLVGGVAVTGVFVALYQRLRETDPAVALWALLLGTAGGLGSSIHGAYDLANFIKVPTVDNDGLPNAIDPRGLATFALAGLSIALVSWLILRGGRLPKRLGQLGFVGAALLVWVYLGRLIILNPKNPGVLIFAVISGFIVNPAWFVWLGVEFRRGEP
jgi:hypothetical protein